MAQVPDQIKNAIPENMKLQISKFFKSIGQENLDEDTQILIFLLTVVLLVLIIVKAIQSSNKLEKSKKKRKGISLSSKSTKDIDTMIANLEKIKKERSLLEVENLISESQ